MSFATKLHVLLTYSTLFCSIVYTVHQLSEMTSLNQWLTLINYSHGTTEYRGIFPRYLPWRKISGTAQHYQSFLCYGRCVCERDWEDPAEKTEGRCWHDSVPSSGFDCCFILAPPIACHPLLSIAICQEICRSSNFESASVRWVWFKIHICNSMHSWIHSPSTSAVFTSMWIGICCRPAYLQLHNVINVVKQKLKSTSLENRNFELWKYSVIKVTKYPSRIRNLGSASQLFV